METLIIIAKSGAILTLFYGLYIAVLRQDTFFRANRYYLLAGIIAALVLPFIQVTNTVYEEYPVFSDIPMFNTAPVQIVTAETAAPINWWLIALIIYGIGVFMMLSRLILQLFSLQKLLSSYPTTKIGQYTYVRVEDDIAPFSFFKYICYNPHLHSQEELEMIIAHEKIHAIQYHTLDVLLTQVLLALQWINPLAWFYKKSLEQNLEFIADQGALDSVHSPQAYQHTLVKVSSTALRPALTNQFYHSLIKKRIVMLNKESSRKSNLWKLGLVLPLLALFMYSFNVKEVVEYREEAGGGNNTAFAKAGAETPTPTDPTFTLRPAMSNSEIETLASLLENETQNLKVRFSQMERNNKGMLVQITIATKYPDQPRFYENITFKSDEKKALSTILLSIVNGNDLQFGNTENNAIARTSPDGMKTEILSSKDPKNGLGENPLHIINGEKKTSQEVKGKNLKLDGAVKMLNKEEAVRKYGEEAKDGALVFKGTTIITEDTPKNKTQQPPVAPTARPEAVKSETPEKKASKSQVNTRSQDIRFKINKNTTDAQLNKLKDQLEKEHGLDLSYTLRRNENKEITTILMSYTGQGKNGNYSINSDTPIDEFYFFMSEDGTPSFWSEKAEARFKEREAQLKERRSQLDAAREERKKALGERREKLQEARGERVEKLEKRREEMKSHIKERSEEMKERMKAQREALREALDTGIKEPNVNPQEESGYVEINGEQHYYSTINGETRYFTKFGKEVDKNGKPLLGAQEEEQATKKERKANQKEIKKRLKENKRDGYRKSFKLSSNDPSLQPLYYLDGKKVSQDVISKIDKTLIDNVTVLEGEKALEIYGKKGKNGVVIITSKKE